MKKHSSNPTAGKSNSNAFQNPPSSRCFHDGPQFPGQLGREGILVIYHEKGAQRVPLDTSPEQLLEKICGAAQSDDVHEVGVWLEAWETLYGPIYGEEFVWLDPQGEETKGSVFDLLRQHRAPQTFAQVLRIGMLRADCNAEAMMSELLWSLDCENSGTPLGLDVAKVVRTAMAPVDEQAAYRLLASPALPKMGPNAGNLWRSIAQEYFAGAGRSSSGQGKGSAARNGRP